MNTLEPTKQQMTRIVGALMACGSSRRDHEVEDAKTVYALIRDMVLEMAAAQAYGSAIHEEDGVCVARAIRSMKGTP